MLRRRLAVCLPLVVAACAVGCNRSETAYRLDEVLHATRGLTESQSASVDSALTELFGDPDEPRLPELAGDLLDPQRLEQAAGPVESHTPGVTQGLFRRHCARCHGISGDGRGPTARYQSPYPRDFRRGVFKWKSTYRDAKPTPADLHATLQNGVPGTAMPSFRLLSEEERETLRQYVVFLAIRGQAERALVDFVAEELPADEPLTLDPELIAEVLEPIVTAWADAETRVLPAVVVSSDTELGHELYHSERAGCYKCHGPSGQGGTVAGKDFEIDYDLWTRDRLVEEPPENATRLIAYDLPILPARPREIVGSTLHGGARWEDLYRRVHQGVAGTPMPAVGGFTPGERGALTDEEIAAVVAYTQTLLQRRVTSE